MILNFDSRSASHIEKIEFVLKKSKFALEYTTGNRGWAPGELFPYSAANPDFSRIYRYDQMVDIVASSAIGKPSSAEFSLTSNVTELGAIFDGSLEIIAVMDVPVYVRKVYLP